MGRAAAVMLAAASAALGACQAGSLVPDAGGTVCLSCPLDGKLSDFEDLAAATIVQAGSPPRNGTWYTYNDDNPKGTDATCVQTPPSGPQVAPALPAPWLPEAPPTVAPSGQGGSFALHVKWQGCTVWGAGIGADINAPLTPDGGVYSGPKVPYDLTPYGGITFWAMATPGAGVQLRVKLPMTAETRVEDGGSCVESPTFKCSDDWGEVFTLPSNGNWKQVTVRFDEGAFKQEGWGAPFAWNPADATSIQIQSDDRTQDYDFWIDDVYLIRQAALRAEWSTDVTVPVGADGTIVFAGFYGDDTVDVPARTLSFELVERKIAYDVR